MVFVLFHDLFALRGHLSYSTNILAGASYEHDGSRVQLHADAHNGTTLFNGGDDGWGRVTWGAAVHTNNSITFVLFDRMWNGFPGIFAACLTHTVTPHEWRVAFDVTPLLKTAPLDLSQPVFFNLDGFRSGGTGTVLDHTLHLPAAGLRFESDELGITTGNILANRKGREFDFWSSSERTVGDALRQKPELPRHCPSQGGYDCGYDETFLLSHEDTGRKDERPAAVLSSPHSGVKMSLFTDRDALHVHTWNERDGALALKRTQGQGPVPQHGAISLEMRDWPDAVNHPKWTNRRTMWGMDGLYTSFATYRFSLEE
ncbi:galactose mutarotase-like domain-containing protein [Chaetomium fimeti]|uniref:Galactose mutarotase-like domain-containing protein n=1 Tax=Chaetomium fimeti TaxID=1854472 RepID=A0AAE0LPE6_9PEZI|nr:galactose mutarotase-like domain-containing protein [Chaetomium fimeti]